MTVHDCRTVVLGGSSGIGLAVAELLVAEEGVDLHVMGPTAEDAERVRSLLGAAAAAHTIDLLVRSPPGRRDRSSLATRPPRQHSRPT